MKSRESGWKSPHPNLLILNVELTLRYLHVWGPGLLYLFMKHITDRYNMYYSYVPTKLNEQIHRAAITQAIVAPIVGLIWMFFFSLLRLGRSGLAWSLLTAPHFNCMQAERGQEE